MRSISSGKVFEHQACDCMYSTARQISILRPYFGVAQRCKAHSCLSCFTALRSRVRSSSPCHASAHLTASLERNDQRSHACPKLARISRAWRALAQLARLPFLPTTGLVLGSLTRLNFVHNVVGRSGVRNTGGIGTVTGAQGGVGKENTADRAGSSDLVLLERTTLAANL